tara:strand:- start:134 stop:499 length:366 start_codon:yes stop_codon:yes gene_type:complete
MTSITVTTNASQVIASLKAKEGKIFKNIQNELVNVGFYMEGKIKESVAGRAAEPRSVDTGRFMGSVRGTAKGNEATVSSGVPYAKDLEFGTTRMTARRHFRNSLSREKQKIANFIEKALKT